METNYDFEKEKERLESYPSGHIGSFFGCTRCQQLEYMLKHERKRAASDVVAFIDSLGDDKTMARVVHELSDKVVSVVEGLQ